MGTTLSPANWVETILADTSPRANYYLEPGRYTADDYIRIAGRGMIGLYGEPGVVIDAQFALEGVGELTFEDIDFEWTPASGDHYKFQATNTTLILRNCSGTSVAEGGLFQGCALSFLSIDTANTGHDSVWDFSGGVLPLYLIDADNGSYVHLRGGSHPGESYLDRVVFQTPTMSDDAAVHLGSGGGHIVNLAVVGNGGNAGLRICRGWAGDIVAYPVKPGLETGVACFRYGICVMGASQVHLHTQGATFAIRDCETGLDIDGGLVFVGEGIAYPGTTTPVVVREETVTLGVVHRR